MPLPIETLGEIDNVVGQWCLSKAPVEIKHQVDYDYEVDGQSVVILEVRPLWRGQLGQKTRIAFAKFQFYKSRNYWQIYWMRASRKWEIYEPCSSVGDLKGLWKLSKQISTGVSLGEVK